MSGFTWENYENEDNLYTDLYQEVLINTEEFSKDSGMIEANNLTSCAIIKSILEQNYDNVKIRPLIADNKSDLYYHITYSNTALQESKKRKKYSNNSTKLNVDFGLGGLDFFQNTAGSIAGLNHALGTATADGACGAVAVGESFDDPEEYTECPNCGQPLEFMGGEKDYWYYYCVNCDDHYFMDRDGNIKFSAEVEDDFITEKIEKHDQLNSDLFNKDNTLKSEVKDKLFEIADKFLDYLKQDDVDLDIKDILLVGSNASYNYTDQSDIDLHILADLSIYDSEELTQKLYNAYKSLFNNKYDPMIYGHEVEVYVEPYTPVEDEKIEEAVSNGVYSLYKGWIKFPQKGNIPDDLDITDVYSDYEDEAKDCKTIEDIDNFLDKIYQLRQKDLIRSGEYSKGNLIFKELRNNGILKELKDKKVDLENKELSLG